MYRDALAAAHAKLALLEDRLREVRQKPELHTPAAGPQLDEEKVEALVQRAQTIWDKAKREETRARGLALGVIIGVLLVSHLYLPFLFGLARITLDIADIFFGRAPIITLASPETSVHSPAPGFSAALQITLDVGLSLVTLFLFLWSHFRRRAQLKWDLSEIDRELTSPRS